MTTPVRPGSRTDRRRWQRGVATVEAVLVVPLVLVPVLLAVIVFGWLSHTRDPKTAYKIGTDAGRVYWVGTNVVCRNDSPRVPGAEYPDQGSSLEVYTNPEPLPKGHALWKVPNVVAGPP